MVVVVVVEVVVEEEVVVVAAMEYVASPPLQHFKALPAPSSATSAALRIMSSWSELCTAAEARPVQSILNSIYASSAVLVPPRCTLTRQLLTHAIQIMFFLTSATAHAFAYRRWSSSLEKASMWPLFGRFSGCACVGSLACP